ncbi:MAG: hypothetical protein PWQ37_2990 [Candidatus Petromonas sp.]|jgi:predicted PurR-regulated permease PerM|nr:hypothetical protein [Candidatus Petromonas sp.]
MFNSNKIPYLNLIPLLVIVFVLYKVINRIDSFLFIKINLLSIISPFLWAFAIAYFLNPLMTYLEREFRFKRGWSILLIYLLAIGIITFGITIISPRIIKSIGELLRDLPDYFTALERTLRFQINNLKLFDKYGVTPYVEDYLNTIIEQVSAYLNTALSTVISQVINLTSLILKIFLALIISVYMLKDKEKFIDGIKRALYAILNKKKANVVIDFGIELDNIISKFIIGKFIDSCIIGAICFVGLLIIKAPYTMLLSLIVGITNMIPYFGPFIGGIPVVTITLFYSPIKALWALVFILLLQQFDGLILGPKILGDSVGLSPFWIILAIVIGGGVFGVIGMFLGVPIMAIIKILFERYVTKKLEVQNINS